MTLRTEKLVRAKHNDVPGTFILARRSENKQVNGVVIKL
jgi:hypothetical protein